MTSYSLDWAQSIAQAHLAACEHGEQTHFGRSEFVVAGHQREAARIDRNQRCGRLVLAEQHAGGRLGDSALVHSRAHGRVALRVDIDHRTCRWWQRRCRRLTAVVSSADTALLVAIAMIRFMEDPSLPLAQVIAIRQRWPSHFGMPSVQLDQMSFGLETRKRSRAVRPAANPAVSRRSPPSGFALHRQ
jgi:hypothetical protein